MTGDSDSIQTCPVLLGRGGTHCESTQYAWQLFGRIAENVLNGNPNPFINPATFVPLNPKGWLEHNEERLWRISTRVLEAQRRGGPFDNATVSELENQTLANASFSNRGTTPLRVWLHGHVGGPFFDFDGGQTIEVWAKRITVAPFVPPDFVEIVPGVEAADTGLVIDSLSQVAIVPIEASRGRNRVLLTVRLHIPQNTVGVIQVPPFARFCQIFQAATGAAVAVYTAFYGNATGAPQVQLPTPDTSRAVPRFFCGDFTHIRTDVDGASERQLIAVFEIEP